jgi:hypothetical protein
MTLLNSLKLASVKRPTTQSPVVYRRNKLSAKLWEQIQIARAVFEGIDYAPTHYKTVVNQTTGEKQEIKVPKRLKKWWWQSTEGQLVVSVFYGNKSLELAKGKNCVALQSQSELIPTLELLKQAVDAGELDTAIEAVSRAVRSKLKPV